MWGGDVGGFRARWWGEVSGEVGGGEEGLCVEI